MDLAAAQLELFLNKIMSETELEKIDKNEEPAMNNKPTKFTNSWGLIVALLIGFWIVGMSVLGAGWLISKEISKTGNTAVNPNQSANSSERVNIADIPLYKSQLGSDDAKVTIVEFADFQCPFCGEWQKTIYPKLKSEYIDTGKVKFIFWELAFLGDESTKVAEASICAKDQNKFWEFHDLVYSRQNGENQGAFSDDKIKGFAAELGLNTDVFNKCVDQRLYKTYVEDSNNKSQEYGITSTPTVAINGIKLEGVMPYENYKMIIESELAK